MSHAIHTVVARAKLKPRREPYWTRIHKGFYLGFRKMTSASEGNWILRSMDPATGKETYNALGDFSEMPTHQRYDSAQQTAMRQIDHINKGGITTVKTIRDACNNYVAHLGQAKTCRSANDAERRFKTYVLNLEPFAALELSKLTPAHIDAWRRRLASQSVRQGLRGTKRRTEGYAVDKLKKKRTPSTLNRDITPFRAALNHAFDEGWVTTDFAWRGKLKPLKDADKPRTLYLDRKQRRALINAAAPDAALFLHGLAVLPVRPGALAGLVVGDFDPRLKSLQIKVDKTGTRTIKLPASVAVLFEKAAKDKPTGAPLFARANGSAWNKDSWKYPVKDAAIAAKMPVGTTAYTLRHSVITDLVGGDEERKIPGLDLLTVAQLSGTSVRMIEKHYGHFRGDVAATALAALGL